MLSSAIGSVPADALHQRAFCNANIGLLQDLAENCLLLVDEGGTVERAIARALEGWPQKYRPRAQELIKRLCRSNRIVRVRREPGLRVECSAEPCSTGVEVAASHTPCTLFTDDECHACVLRQAAPVNAVSAQDYQTSEFAALRRRVAGGYTVRDQEWTQRDFEKFILRPVFSHAKYVKIIDRYVGGRTADGRGVSDDYRRSLKWMLRVFMDSIPQAEGRPFEVYCGLHSPFHKHHGSPLDGRLAHARESLRSFEKEQRESGAPLTIIIKKEGPVGEMPHARFLFTDQVALIVERGFDLLWGDGKMKSARLRLARDPRPIKDVTITLCHNPDGIEKSVNVLPTLS